MSVGDEIEAGTYLGRIAVVKAEAGNSSGPHVHVEERERGKTWWGKRVDPGSGNPLKSNSILTNRFGGAHEGVDYGPDAEARKKFSEKYGELTPEGWLKQ